MKVFIILSAVIALAAARPGVYAPLAYSTPFAYAAAPVAYAAAPVVPVEVSSQYHAQDSLGQYNYGYADSLSSKAESRSINGITQGAYSYVDAEGKHQTVSYTADDVHGFRVAASNLPVAPAVPVAPEVAMPEQVKDTEEVAKAKIAHFAAVDEAKARVAAAPVEVEVAAPLVHYAAPVTSYAAAPVVSYSAPAYTTYAHHPYGYYPYNSAFGYQYSAVAPAYHAYQPFVTTPFVGAPVAPVAAVADSDDTVEVKAKDE